MPENEIPPHPPGMPPPPPPRPQRPAAPVVEPANLPRGFWRRLDYIILNPETVIESIRRDADLWGLSRALLVIIVAMGFIYGAIMGATNLLQGSSLSLGVELMMVVVTAVKVPVLFLLTLLIVMPPVYISNAFAGGRMEFRRMLALLVAALTVTLITLASMASVAFFFALTSQSYHFIKLLHVVFYVYAGLAGLVFLWKSVSRVSHGTQKRTPGLLFVAWLILYMFVGTNLAWVLRPFIGTPALGFELFRERQGNFYESVLDAVKKSVADE